MKKPQGEHGVFPKGWEKWLWAALLTVLAILVAPIPRSSGGDGYYAAAPAQIIVDGRGSCYYAAVVTKDGNDSLYRRLIGERPDNLAEVDDIPDGKSVHENAEGAAWAFVGYPKNTIELPSNLKQAASAGLAMTLALIDANTPGRLLPEGECIAATGVVGKDGTVYEIGGAASKAEGVSQSGITLFFVPVENAQGAQHEGIHVVPILTVSQAVAYLCAHGGADQICESVR